MIGFGIVMPVLPTLVEELALVGPGDAARIDEWLLAGALTAAAAAIVLAAAPRPIGRPADGAPG